MEEVLYRYSAVQTCYGQCIAMKKRFFLRGFFVPCAPEMMEPVNISAVLKLWLPSKLALTKAAWPELMNRNETVKKTLTALALMFGLITALMATTARAEIGVAGDVGTTGIGFHATVPVNPNINARFGLGYLGYNYKGSTRDMNYDLDLTANTYDALLDWYPSKDSAFRITAGLAYNANKIDVHARPNASGSYTIQGNTYSAASVGSVTGKVDFNKIAPYLGIGWGRPAKNEKGWSIATDLGVLFQGSPKTSLTSSACSAPAALCNQFASDVARENSALAEEVRKFKVYPVLRIGVSYKF